MKKEGVSALAVVDPSGKLVGNFSASDLKGLFRQRLPDFLKSVEQFLKDHSPGSPRYNCRHYSPVHRSCRARSIRCCPKRS